MIVFPFLIKNRQSRDVLKPVLELSAFVDRKSSFFALDRLRLLKRWGSVTATMLEQT